VVDGSVESSGRTIPTAGAVKSKSAGPPFGTASRQPFLQRARSLDSVSTTQRYPPAWSSARPGIVSAIVREFGRRTRASARKRPLESRTPPRSAPLLQTSTASRSAVVSPLTSNAKASMFPFAVNDFDATGE
jgi:hypothetical protein